MEHSPEKSVLYAYSQDCGEKKLLFIDTNTNSKSVHKIENAIRYAELNCLTNFSFLKSASHPEEMVRQAVLNGYDALAITDECSVAGIVKAWREAKNYPDFKLIIGSEFIHEKNRFVLIAPTFEAYSELCNLITYCRRNADKGQYFFKPELLKDFSRHCILLWSPSSDIEQNCNDKKKPSKNKADTERDKTTHSITEFKKFAKPRLETKKHTDSKSFSTEIPSKENKENLENEKCIKLIQSKFSESYDDNYRAPWYEIMLCEYFRDRSYLLLSIHLSENDESEYRRITSLSAQLGIPIIPSSRPVMHIPERRTLQDCLHAIRTGKTIHEIRMDISRNNENHLKSLFALQSIHKKSWLSNTIRIANQCTFTLDQIKYQYPEEITPPRTNASTYLKYCTYAGARRLYKVEDNASLPPVLTRLLEKELGIISELEYEYYFLTIYDLVSFARKNNILCQGRGSAANSAVCYCLGITAVDPTRFSMLFERFVSRRRNEPPDIDVDFENERREEVIQYLYKKYGRERCALAATVVTYRPKSAIRDLGKALGLDLAQLENVIVNFGWRYRGKNWIEEVITEKLSIDNHILSHFKSALSQLLGFPRHLSQHVGGFVITRDKLTDLVPVENASMADRTVIQWDKDDLEALGLMKVDVLALGMLTAIRKTLESISQRCSGNLEMTDIPVEDDPEVFGMLQAADSVGLFQVESRAQMNMLPRLKPDKFYDLVVQVAIVRPGPIHGDMVHPYLKRKRGLEAPDVPLPELQPILARTYGVPIFQEQVIAMAMYSAGFSADEAEELRRSMASWKQEGHMNALRMKMMDRLARKGVTNEYIDRICRQIEGFGEYGFPESHAASFALLSYVSAWLKYYFPADFCCALLNSQPMGFYQPWQLIQDLQRHAINVLPVDINFSQWDHSLELSTSEKIDFSKPKHNPTTIQVRLGFRAIKGLSRETMNLLLDQKPADGYQKWKQLQQLTGVNTETLELLASAGAFKSLDENRFANHWQAGGHDFYPLLFRNESTKRIDIREPDRYENLCNGYSTTKILLDDHPVGCLRDMGLLEACTSAAQIFEKKNGEEVFIAGIVINRQRPKTATGVTFLTLEDETGSFNVVVWLQTARKQMKTLVTSNMLKIYGKIDRDSDSQIIHIVAYKILDISSLFDKLKLVSRDFH